MQVALSPRRRLGTFRLGETVAHQIGTGFWYVWQTNVDLLDDEFLQIWNGEGGTYAACDRIYFAFNQGASAWNHNMDQPPPKTQPPDSPAWWNDGPDDPPDFERTMTWREANAWVGRNPNEAGTGSAVCALSKVRDMNDPPTNPRAMRAVISRALWGLVYPGSGATPWSIARLKAYVGRVCERLEKGTAIGDANLRNACLGWNLADDTFTSAVSCSTASLDAWEEVLDAVHEIQTDHGLNLPFYFNWNLDQGIFWQRVWDATGGQIVYESNPYPPPTYRYWRYVIPSWVREAIDKKSKGGRFPDTAIRIIMPYYYPWASWDESAQYNQWRYSTLPPYMKWMQAVQALDSAFPFCENEDLQIQPVLPSGQIRALNPPSSTPMPPGHADMHKQIRVLLDMEPKKRITGLWFIGWTNAGESDIGPEGYAKDHWTSTSTYRERWAEAIQNEIGDDITQPTTESITAAKPTSSGLLIPVTDFTISEGIRIGYQLHEAARIKITVTDTTTSEVVWEPEDSFGGKTPAGFYTRDGVTVPGATCTERLYGTSAFWNGYVRWPQNQESAEYAVIGRDYRVKLLKIVNGSETQLGSSVIVNRTA